MALVDRRGLRRSALPAVAASRAAAKKQQRRHRVVIESVAQEQKKLKTTLSFQARPPNGYTFIPAGNPDLTNALKEASRQANQQIYAVSASPHANVHDLSKEVHRIGFHFPSIIVAEVCTRYGITLTSKGVVAEENADTFRQMRRKGRQDKETSDENKDQITINTEARGAIKDLFPMIPENDLYTIIKGAFQKGQKKVGTANELPLIRRAQLSVVAHIRHVYTRYDKLLRTVGYRDARSQVEGPTLKKLVEWRGDDDSTGDGKQVLEDVFREVIVLSDDEDSDDDDDIVEVVSTRPNGWPLPSHHSIASAQPLSPRQYGYLSADDDPPGYRVVTQPSRRQQVVDSGPAGTGSNLYRESRYAAWDRAREEYRTNPSGVPEALVPLAQHDPQFYYSEPDFNFNDPPSRDRQRLIEKSRAREPGIYSPRQVLHESRPSQPEYIRGADGHLYEKVYTYPQESSALPRKYEASENYVSALPPSPRHVLLHKEQDPRAQAVSSKILPSIEGSQGFPEDGRSYASLNEHRKFQPSAKYEARAPPMTRLRNVEIIDITTSVDVQGTKRRRVDEPAANRRVTTNLEGQTPTRQSGAITTVLDARNHKPEIIDLTSPVYVRKPLHRVQSGDVRMMETQVAHSHVQPLRSILEAPPDVPRVRRAYGTEPIHSQTQGIRFASPPRNRHESHLPYSSSEHFHRPNLGIVRTIHQFAPKTLSRATPGHREVLIPTGLPANVVDSTHYSRGYVPLKQDDLLRARVPQSFYVDSHGTQHNRYMAMPPPSFVRE